MVPLLFRSLANPFLIAAWLAYGKRKHQLSLMLSMAAAGLMLSFTLVAEMEVGTSGSAKTITSYGLGYYLWVSSALAQVFASSFSPKFPTCRPTRRWRRPQTFSHGRCI